MVSIAESLNYRIFERKWRPGEASNGHPRACRIAQCRTKTQPQKESWLVICAPVSIHVGIVCVAAEWLPRINRQTVDSWVMNVSKIRSLPPSHPVSHGAGLEGVRE